MNPHVKRIRAIADKLRGTGGGQAMSAIADVCNDLHQFSDRLDAKNRSLAALALCSVLSQRHLGDTIIDLAKLVGEE